MVSGFQIDVMELLRPQTAAGDGGNGGEPDCGQQRRWRAGFARVFAGWQVDHLRQRRQAASQPCFRTGAGRRDGTKLLVLGGVGTAATVGGGGTSFQLYSVALVPVDKDPNDRDINTEAQADAPEGATGGRGGGFGGGGRGRGARGGGDAEPAGPLVKIEWDGLEQRVQQLT